MDYYSTRLVDEKYNHSPASRDRAPAARDYLCGLLPLIRMFASKLREMELSDEEVNYVIATQLQHISNHYHAKNRDLFTTDTMIGSPFDHWLGEYSPDTIRADYAVNKVLKVGEMSKEPTSIEKAASALADFFRSTTPPNVINARPTGNLGVKRPEFPVKREQSYRQRSSKSFSEIIKVINEPETLVEVETPVEAIVTGPIIPAVEMPSLLNKRFKKIRGRLILVVTRVLEAHDMVELKPENKLDKAKPADILMVPIKDVLDVTKFKSVE